VGSYTITFTPDDVTNASAVVRVDLGASGARITELTVRAGSGDGLVPGELPGFDLGRLMRAIAPAGATAPAFELSATPSAVTAAASYTTGPAGAPARKTAGRAAAGRGAGTKQTAKQTGAKKAAKAAPGTGRAARAASGSAGGTRSGAGRSATRSSGAAAARTGTSRGGTGRAYRRTPTDIVEVFTQAPSATALARHYGVPRHTVQGWLRRLRAEGILPPSSRAA
jgi:Helix-turn-helix domain